ncbi:MAG: YbgC/FadM family acyl-CoA thioesterase [Alphaproteobacteria bacterium]|nr:YbgC/FadM family acyl-CoA thioesterase [Alphaproteobacteria bacterium]
MPQKTNKISIFNFNNTIRVYYEDTDSGGVVYHANYLKYAERSRTEMLRKYKIEQEKLKTDFNIQFIVKNLFIEYYAFAKLDDLLNIKSLIIQISSAKIIMEQSIFNKKKLLAKINVTLGSVNLEGKPSRLPKFVLDILNTT